MVTRCLVMETGCLIWTFPLTSIYCTYTLFHFLTSTFFLSCRNTFHSPTYLTLLSLSLSLSLSISPTHKLSLSLLLYDRISHCKRLVSRQVLRPIKLSTSLVDIKDANTQSAHGRQACRPTPTQMHNAKDDNSNTRAQTSHPHEKPAEVHTHFLRGSKPTRQTVSHRDYERSWQCDLDTATVWTCT